MSAQDSQGKLVPESGLLTADQVGEIYQVTGATVRNWFREGAIPAEVNEGKVIRFDRAAVAAALRKRVRASRGQVPAGKAMVI